MRRDLREFESMVEPLPMPLVYEASKHVVGTGDHFRLTWRDARFSVVRFTIGLASGSYGAVEGLWELMLPDGEVVGYLRMDQVSEFVAAWTYDRTD